MFNSLANRKRAPGGGRKPTLRTGETILYLTVLQMLSEESEIVQYIPDEVVIEGDLGFQGLQKEFVN
ncbi:hypothetical protein ACRYJJ_07840 [Cylindrospermopsis raciborskii G7]|uniref:hypothetical protein n=1 Tax=Cylindrospermopsis raciborskii TaxID=77022 RepID=UPI002ED92E14